MSLDPAIREQTYHYFLQEAPELLQALEQGLLNFKTDRGISQVNNLMRVTHTLKGAAISVGLETIATIAHSLEDIFKALCQPNLTLQPDTEALLFEGVECLRLPLIAELTGGMVNHTEILDRAAAIFAQLQEQLGDCFNQVAQLPSSAELGFDVTLSIFELGVAQRLDQIAATMEQGQPEEIAATLRTQAEVFLGLAESLNLPGFGSIASLVLTALTQHPDQAQAIAEVALADFRNGQAAVLAGDRTQGGQASERLQQLANVELKAVSLVPTIEAEQEEDANQQFDSLLNQIWGGQAIEPDQTEEEAVTPLDQPVSITLIQEVEEPIYTVSPSPVNPPTPIPQRDPIAPAPQIRVNVQYLDQVNNAIGELITHQNRQLLQTEQLQSTVKTLFTRFKQHQQLLQQLRQQAKRQSDWQEKTRSRTGKKKAKSAGKSKRQAFSDATAVDLSPQIQTLLDDMIQLTEIADAIELFADQANQTIGQQQHLLTSARNALIEARMLPLGKIFNRLPAVLQQLETLSQKQVILDLQGAEVLVDKVIAEKLYDPLLHLVRNAFDHGIEAELIRQQQGKPAKGKIEISAYNQGRFLTIVVQDDGKGLAFDQIRQRAVERRLISPEQANRLNDTQLIDLLFEPGFSTATQINDISGRGIGLDVVKNQIQALQGSITVQTQPDQGTKFLLKIPLNLTIAQLLVCEAENKLYALLDDSIEQIILPQAEQLKERENCRVLQWGDDDEKIWVPIYTLSNLLHYQSTVCPISSPSIPHPPSSVKPIILIYHQDSLFGLEVDQLVGEQELIIRPLSNLLAVPSYIHGACIVADGRSALVIDAAMVIDKTLSWQPDRSDTVAESNRWNEVATSSLAVAVQPKLLPQLLPAQPTQLTLVSPSLPSPRSQAQVLIVDDSITARQNLALVLQKAGYQVLQAENGFEAITQLNYYSTVQLVICDLEMPVMNGFEFLRHLQHTPDLNVPVLMLTSRTDEKFVSLALQLGAAAYMTKPYIEHRLLTAIADLVAQKV